MAETRFQLKGAREMEKVLRAMPKAVAQAETERAMIFAAKPLRDEAKRLVRKGATGDLERSITLSRTKRAQGRRRRLAGVIFLGFKRPESRRAHLTEFGTRFARAFPFLRPALDSQAEVYLARLGKKLGENIEKTAAELAGRFRSIRRGVRRRL